MAEWTTVPKQPPMSTTGFMIDPFLTTPFMVAEYSDGWTKVPRENEDD